jgi:hypothetical protein
MSDAMSLHFPFPRIPAAAELIEVAPGVFWLRMPLPFQLDHINLWLLRDGDGWTIIDTGFPDDAVRSTWQQILKSLDGPVKRLIVTHFHPDHLGLASWLMAETGASLVDDQRRVPDGPRRLARGCRAWGAFHGRAVPPAWAGWRTAGQVCQPRFRVSQGRTGLARVLSAGESRRCIQDRLSHLANNHRLWSRSGTYVALLC